MGASLATMGAGARASAGPAGTAGAVSGCTQYPCLAAGPTSPLGAPWFSADPSGGGGKCYAPDGTPGAASDPDIPGMGAWAYGAQSGAQRAAWLAQYQTPATPTPFTADLCDLGTRAVYPCTIAGVTVGAPWIKMGPTDSWCYAPSGVGLPCQNAAPVWMPHWGSANFEGYTAPQMTNWIAQCTAPPGTCVGGPCAPPVPPPTPPTPPTPPPTCTSCTPTPTPAGCTGCGPTPPTPPTPPACTSCSPNLPRGCVGGCPPPCTSCGATPLPSGCVGCTSTPCTSCGPPVVPAGCTLASGQCPPPPPHPTIPAYVWLMVVGVVVLGVYSAFLQRRKAAAVVHP